MKSKLIIDKLPKHIAIIMDGNGRWAKKSGAERIFGHENGVKSVRESVELCAELKINYLTLYAFSTENWNRPQHEVDALMELLVQSVVNETKTLMDNNIRLTMIGDHTRLPFSCNNALQKVITETAENKGLTLVLALSYSGRWDIINAVKKLAEDIHDQKVLPDIIDECMFSKYLATQNMPDPDLLIRTSGEFRISNFLLWQLAYSEIHITDVLWPDFRKEHLYEALFDYQARERRYGKTSDQIK